MNRIILVTACLAVSSAFAEDKMAGATTEPGSQMTCGQMMASKAVMPQKMSELLTNVADNLEAHAKWVGTKDKAAKAENDQLIKVAKEHRAIAASMKKTAETMQKGKDLAQAPHDMKTMDPKMAEGMTRQIALEREMASLLQKDADDAEKHLSSMKTTAGGK